MPERIAKDLGDFSMPFRAFLILAPLAWLCCASLSIVAVIASLFAWGLVELTVRRKIPPAWVSPVFWLGWGLIAPLRILEYGPGASIRDFLYPIFFFGFSAAGLVGTIAAVIHLGKRRAFGAAAAALLAIPVGWWIWIELFAVLSEWLHVTYR